VWHDSFMCETHPPHLRDIHDPFTWVIRPVNVCDMQRSYVKYNSFICTTHSYVWRDSLLMWIYLCVSICLFVYQYVCVSICVFMYKCVRVCACEYVLMVWVYMCVSVCVFVYICVCVRAHVWIYMCICIAPCQLTLTNTHAHTHTHTHTHTRTHTGREAGTEIKCESFAYCRNLSPSSHID